MSRDLVIRWASPLDAPPNAALGILLANYTRGLASTRWAAGRWVATLPGDPSAALAGLVPSTRLFEPGWKREIEVWRSAREPVVYVMTGGADDVTNAVAEGLAELIARHWRGEREA